MEKLLYARYLAAKAAELALRTPPLHLEASVHWLVRIQQAP